MRSFILFGYYGFGNIGDEQLLDESVKILKKTHPNHPIIIANGPNPIPFNTFNRFNLLKWVCLLKNQTPLILGGGSIFQSMTSCRSLLFYLAIIRIALMRQSRVILLCHGWGPFKKNWHEKIARNLLLHQHIYRSWRDQQSQQTFGISTDPVFCDLTLTEPIPKPPDTLNQAVIGICTESSRYPHIIDTIKRLDAQTVTITCQPKQTNHLVDIQLCDTWQLPLDIGLLITDRYHGAIWASKFGIPWIAISEDPKLKALAHSANQPLIRHSQSHKLLQLIHETITATPSKPLRDWYRSHANHRVAIETWLNHAISL